MKNRVIPFPRTFQDPSPEQEELFWAAGQDLIDDVAAEPVPERLNMLAVELGRALDQRRAALSHKDKDRS